MQNELQKRKISETALPCKKIKNGCGVIDTGCTMHAKFKTPCAQWTNDSVLATFKGNIYQKHICSRIVIPHNYKKIYKIKELPNKNKKRRLKCPLSPKIHSRIHKGVQGGLFDEKNRGS
jgi:hypothetical protein